MTLEKVGDDVPLTPEPVIEQEEKSIIPRAELGEGAAHCPECGYRNMPEWGRCYACGAKLEAKKAVAVGEPVKLIASFEDRNPFGEGTIVSEHATDGAKALRIDRSYVSMVAAQDWSGYDLIKADVHTDAKEPLPRLREGPPPLPLRQLLQTRPTLADRPIPRANECGAAARLCHLLPRLDERCVLQ